MSWERALKNKILEVFSAASISIDQELVGTSM